MTDIAIFAAALVMITLTVMMMMGRVENIGQAPARTTRVRQRRRQEIWRNHMLDAWRKLLGEPEAPPPAQDMTVQRTSQAVHTDPDMPGIPASARPRIVRINELLAQIDARIGDDVLGQPLIIEIEQMRDRHLPKLLKSYVEIPAERRREIFNRTQKSASVHLEESLDALVRRLEEMSRSITQENLDTFEDNARFISRTYGQGGDPLI